MSLPAPLTEDTPRPTTAEQTTAEQTTAEQTTAEPALPEEDARWPGLLLAVGLAALAAGLAQIDLIGETLHLGPVVLAILLGAAVRNTAALPRSVQPGVQVAVKPVLSAAIVLLGFELSLAEVARVGGAGLAVVSVVVASTLGVGYLAGRTLGLGRRFSLLIAAGCSICGTSAVAATDAVVGADEEETAYAIAVVGLLGTVSMFALPLAQIALALPQTVYGAWAGASIHSVGQAVAAGFAVSPEAGETASLIKLTRVTFLAPVTLGLSLLFARDGETNGSGSAWSAVSVPWFVVGFLAAAAVRSTGLLPAVLTDGLALLDTFLLATAMAGMGLEIRLAAMRRTGLTPLWAGALTTGFITLLALGLARWAF